MYTIYWSATSSLYVTLQRLLSCLNSYLSVASRGQNLLSTWCLSIEDYKLSQLGIIIFNLQPSCQNKGSAISLRDLHYCKIYGTKLEIILSICYYVDKHKFIEIWTNFEQEDVTCDRSESQSRLIFSFDC